MTFSCFLSAILTCLSVCRSVGLSVGLWTIVSSVNDLSL